MRYAYRWDRKRCQPSTGPSNRRGTMLTMQHGLPGKALPSTETMNGCLDEATRIGRNLIDKLAQAESIGRDQATPPLRGISYWSEHFVRR